eukprot:12809287-Heterocapsa_arctica.AAC.1
MAGEEHEKEDTKDVQCTQEQHKLYEDITVTQISGEQQYEEDTKTTDCSEVGQIIGHKKQQNYHRYQHVDLKEKDIYPGVSSQQRVRIRAEQLFKEGQADKVIKKQEALQNQLHKK